MVVEHAEARGRLPGVGPGGDQEGVLAARQARGVHERIASLGERPAKDRLDDVGVEHVRGPPQQLRCGRLDAIVEIDHDTEPQATGTLVVVDGGVAVRAHLPHPHPDVGRSDQLADAEALELGQAGVRLAR